LGEAGSLYVVEDGARPEMRSIAGVAGAAGGPTEIGAAGLLTRHGPRRGRGPYPKATTLEVVEAAMLNVREQHRARTYKIV
jgi:hypothetical protein